MPTSAVANRRWPPMNTELVLAVNRERMAVVATIPIAVPAPLSHSHKAVPAMCRRFPGMLPG